MENWKVNNSGAVFSAESSAPQNNTNLKDFIKNKKLAIGGCACLIILAILAVILFLPKRQQVVILVAPETAEISIDGKTYKNGTYSLPIGNHFVEISAEGFSYIEYELPIEEDEPALIQEYLDEDGAFYTERDYEILSLIAEDDYTISKINARARAKTIFDFLPILDDTHKVYVTDQRFSDYCKVQDKLCLGITNLGDYSEESTYNAIRKAGYDPNDYQILYEYKSNNFYKES